MERFGDDWLESFLVTFLDQGAFLEEKLQGARSVMKKESGKFVYTLEVPGYNKRDVNLNVENDKLIVQFEDKARSVRLPQSVDIDKISTTCENGFLKVDLPISDGAKARKIEIS